MKSAISTKSLAYFQQRIGAHVSQEDIFYYCYGLFHCGDYRKKFANNLTKEIPQIPCLEEHFNTLLHAGRQLGDLHVNFEKQPMYEGLTIDKREENYTVKKMKFGKNKDRSVIVYNPYITISDIPDVAYDYHIDGKSVIELVMARLQYKQDKNSGIINDPNKYQDTSYPFELLLKVIGISVKTVEVMNNLEKLTIS